jgi:hypothetical protein
MLPSFIFGPSRKIKKHIKVTMHKKSIWFLCLCIAGCTAMASERGSPSGEWSAPSIALTNIDKVQLGMTYGEVASIMGDTVSIGYRENDDVDGAYEEMLIKNPHYDEVFKGIEAHYRVVYYFTHIRKADGLVTDDELTPLVFEENRLVGKDRKFLFELKDKLK